VATVKVKLLDERAQLPAYAHEGDAGLDLTCVAIEHDPIFGITTYRTGLAFDIPKGFAGFVYPRSSIYKTGEFFTNSVGVVDSGYKGEVTVKTAFLNKDAPTIYKVGDRVGQIVFMPVPVIQLVRTTDVGSSTRGAGGYGSTGA
jgi:dUTP pyrophosphatase